MLFPPLRSGWTQRGERASVEISGGNAKRVVLGTISLTGHRLLQPHPKQRSLDFCEFLHFVREHYRSQKLLMLIDGDSSHTAKASQQTADDLGIMFERLPVRCPELNPIESLWGDGKDVICANHQYPDIDVQTNEFIEYLLSLTNNEAKRKAGLLSDNHWLFS